MRISKISVLLPFAFAMCFSLFSAPAHAQATRTWVSGVGDDANPCSRTAPCKTWAGAESKTAAGGEIDALDPGGFGAVTITKSLTLDGGGGQVASILVAGTNGVNVSAVSTDVVILRNIRFDGLLGNGGNSGNAGLTAIQFNSGGVLIVEKCEIFGFANNGIGIVPNNNAKVSISETHIQNVAFNAGTAGILIAPSANVNVTVSKSWVEDTAQSAIFASGAVGVIHLNVKDSVVTHAGGNGVQISSAGGGPVVSGEVIGTQISYTSTGASVSGASASLTLGENSITNNVTGVSAPSGTLLSYKNNMINDNVSNGTPITAVAGYTNGGQ